MERVQRTVDLLMKSTSGKYMATTVGITTRTNADIEVARKPIQVERFSAFRVHT